MHTENSIWIAASPERVFALAADIASWPALLPHYRWVKIIEEQPNERLVEMAARRSGIPVKWTSVQRLYPEAGRITYRHLRGLTVGMDVEWQVIAQAGGAAAVIIHELAPRHILLRNPLGAWIASELFIKNIADRTLWHIKAAAEKMGD